MKYTPMMEQYLAMKATVPDALLFFRLGDFYELFFEDALNASKLLEITLTGRDAGQTERVPMCGVPHHAVEGYIARLVEMGIKVAIAEQVENPQDAKGVVKREIVRLITPGTVLEAKSLQENRNNFIASVVYHGADAAGCVIADWSTGEIHISDDTQWGSCREALTVFRPREVIGRPDTLERLKRELGLLADGWVLSEWSEGSEWIEEPARAVVSDAPAGAQEAAGMLRAYFLYTQKQSPIHMQRVHVLRAGGRLLLDPLTRRSLELTETVREKEKKGSLLWLLDETRTSMGARLMRQWLEQPLCDTAAIESRQDAVEQLADGWMVRETIRESLKEVYDLERLTARVSVGSANARDLIALQRSLEQIPALAEAALASGSRTLAESAKPLDRCQDLCADIAATLVAEPPVSLRDGGLIREGVDAQLDAWRDASRNGKQWMADLEMRERERTGIRSLKVGYNKVFGYYIEVTKANLASLPEGIYERKQTLSTGERYVTPELKEQEMLILQAEEKLTGREFELFTELRLRISAQLTRLHRLAYWVATLDVFQSLASVAVMRRWVKPAIHSGFDLRIRLGRHPVVESVLNDQSFIANDTQLIQGESMMLITGPNMAGKSTYMRQAALICILGQMGSFVPAEEAQLPLIDRIFTRIGAADDLVAGQSTFMTEMMDIRMMTEKATRNSLVIIDELGRGTSTDEGMAIAQAVIEHLHDQTGCKTFVSTHFHELARLEAHLPELVNYTMAVREQADQVTFLRKLIRGAAQSSYGIYCAQLAGLPDSVIRRARHILENPSSVRMSTEIQDEQTSQLQSERSVHVYQPAPVPVQPEVIEIVKYVDHALLEELKQLNLSQLTPIQALVMLDRWQQQIREPQYVQREA